MSYKREEKKKPQGALVPLYGFLVMVVAGGLSFLVAPAIRTFLETTTWYFGAFGWRVLPLTFPGAWSELTVRFAISGVLFLMVFMLFMIVALMIGAGPEEESLQYIRERQDEIRKKRRR